MARATGNVTKLLKAVNVGEPEAWEALLALIYSELRHIAGRQMRKERRGHTLQRTALVNEAYLRLVGGENPKWENRTHFFSAAAEAMRRTLVDHARKHKAEKRGGDGRRIRRTLEGADGKPSVGLSMESPEPEQVEQQYLDFDALDVALAKLEAIDRHREKCTIVKLRCFAGLSVEETAAALNISTATVKRDWTFARAWLYREMTGN